MKQFTLAGLVLTLGAAAAFAATPDPGDVQTTHKDSYKTVRNTHETLVQVNNYVTKVLGIATWDGYADNPFTDRYNIAQFNYNPTLEELRHAYGDAEARIVDRLSSTGGRGQINIVAHSDLIAGSTGRETEKGYTVNHSAQDNSSTKKVESNSSTSTSVDKVTKTELPEQIVITFGPDTIRIGDLDSGGTDYVLADGETNFNHIHTTQVDTYQTKTTTTNTETTYTVSGELYSSPIVLDLSGTGKIGASDGHWLPHPKAFYTKHRVMFDFFGNGFPVAMEWVGETDGLLVRPKADGKVDGTCLFGSANGYTNGYEQLATLDLNLDGHVSGKELAGLSVWQDKNGDGKCDAGELQTVQQLGITDFNLKHTQYKSSFTMKGKTQTMYDWWPTMFEIKKNKQPV
ncbi:MAG: hypothetical protein KF760_14370 [Candidatus Eremiobacteraeota bacterium]|nr:hypothetical protein [Candidatus Eremiobacteraeota bacterium]MCW5868271.1 hypothetical protein [Candidatus Eremiobacteraeota bacterium]